jgi:hypothetical protein
MRRPTGQASQQHIFSKYHVWESFGSLSWEWEALSSKLDPNYQLLTREINDSHFEKHRTIIFCPITTFFCPDFPHPGKPPDGSRPCGVAELLNGNYRTTPKRHFCLTTTIEPCTNSPSTPIASEK